MPEPTSPMNWTPCPERSAVTDFACYLAAGNHRFHQSKMGEVWENEDYDDPSITPERKPIEVVQDAEPTETAGPAVFLPVKPGDSGPAYDGTTDSPMWVNDTLEQFREFLSTRTEPFTTPEDFWPLVQRGPGMREMQQVISKALRQGWIEEVAAKRLRGFYSTADGHEFRMNKLVPVYESRVQRREGSTPSWDT